MFEGFHGEVDARGNFVVVVSIGGATRPLSPPTGKKFRWGDMGGDVGGLAMAMAEAMYTPASTLPGGTMERIATQIHKHFLTGIKKNDAWDLEFASIHSYLVERLQGSSGMPARVMGA